VPEIDDLLDAKLITLMDENMILSNFFQWEAKAMETGEMSLKFFDSNGLHNIGLGSFHYNESTGALESFVASVAIDRRIFSWSWDNQGDGNAIIYLHKPTWNLQEGQPKFGQNHHDNRNSLWQFITTQGSVTGEEYLEVMLFGSTHPLLLSGDCRKNHGLVWLREERWFLRNSVDIFKWLPA